MLVELFNYSIVKCPLFKSYLICPAFTLLNYSKLEVEQVGKLQQRIAHMDLLCYLFFNDPYNLIVLLTSSRVMYLRCFKCLVQFYLSGNHSYDSTQYLLFGIITISYQTGNRVNV